jgi:hypothetical protein
LGLDWIRDLLGSCDAYTTVFRILTLNVFVVFDRRNLAITGTVAHVVLMRASTAERSLGARGGVMSPLMARATFLLFITALVAMTVGTEASRADEGGSKSKKTVLERWMHGQAHAVPPPEPMADIWPEELGIEMDELGEGEDFFEGGRALAVRPSTTIRVTACTTLVIATFPDTCKNYSSPAPCSFAFQQQGVRQLYDCKDIRKLAATSYLNTPPPGLQVRNPHTVPKESPPMAAANILRHSSKQRVNNIRLVCVCSTLRTADRHVHLLVRHPAQRHG